MTGPPKSSGNFSGVLWGAVAFFIVVTLLRPRPQPVDPDVTGQSPSATATSTTGSTTTTTMTGTQPDNPEVTPPVVTDNPEIVLTLEDDRRTVVVTSKGASIASYHLKINETSAVRGHGHDLLATFDGTRPHYGTQVAGLEVDLRATRWRVLSHSPTEVTFMAEAGGATVRKTLRLGEGYLIDIDIQVDGMADPVIIQDSACGLEPAGNAGIQMGGTYFLNSFFIAKRKSGSSLIFDSDFGDLEDHEPSGLKDSDEDDGIQGTDLRWVGHMDTYFVAAMKAVPGATGTLGLVARGDSEDPSGIRGGLRVSGPTLSTSSYLGPRHHDTLENLDPDLTLTFESGWLGPIMAVLLFILETLYSVVGSYGISIILLTLVVRLAIHPLSRRGQLKMAIYQERIAKIQPKIEQLKKKHEGDRHGFAQAQMKLMRDNNISGGMMLGGCLPLFLQMPIFLSLYYMLQENIELRGTQFMWITDLSLPDRLMELPIFPGELNILPLMTLAVTVIQMKRSMNRAQAKLSPEQEATQKMMLFMMPGIMIIFTYSFAAGLLLYWFTSALFGIIESEMMRRRITALKAAGVIK